MVLLFYFKSMLEKVTMQRTQLSSFFVAKRTDQKNPVKCCACVVSKKLRLGEKLRYAYFSRTTRQKFHEIWHENTLRNKELEDYKKIEP